MSERPATGTRSEIDWHMRVYCGFFWIKHYDPPPDTMVRATARAPSAMAVSSKVNTSYLKTLHSGICMVKTVQLDERITVEGVAESIKSLMVQYDILFVGEALFDKQMEAVMGEPYRFVSFYSFCVLRCHGRRQDD